MMLFDFSGLFVIVIIFGCIATGFYYFIWAKVQQVGGHARLIVWLPGQLKMFRDYRLFAKTKNWPLWPLYGYWIAVTAMFLTWITMMILTYRWLPIHTPNHQPLP
jgi:hypothetical protein